MLTWVIERSLFFANDEMHVVAALKQRGAKVHWIDFIPFSHELTPLPKSNHNILLGSTGAIRAGLGLGWNPGVWYNENFDFPVWREQYGPLALNYDATIQSFGQLAFAGTQFVRPCADLKAFSGALVHNDALAAWKVQALRYTELAEDYQVQDALPCVVAAPKAIDAEFRFFVVNGQVRTGCQYRRAGRLEHTVEGMEEAKTFAMQMAAQWQPAPGFVLDIAATPDGFRVIEINCLNSAGFYACPPEALIEAIEAL